MISTRTGRRATAALALAAATTFAAVPAHANPADVAAPGVSSVQYVAQAGGSADGGSLDDPIVQAGLLIIAGIGVSAALAISAGIAGGAIQLPSIPGF
ncbi:MULTISPECIES: hypothetical protein [Dietzia]|uniref:Secreted protein n=1 Tax=Dietzia maris TaxID=37915 RepID=A0ABT8GZH3_9ACTN|nr:MULTISPECIES: hypothetical protein [Dietzia]MDJ0422928.1 hypothetical protein [Dietzia kunjamensis]MDN4505615.1 hypothetical protein [Dietzia maris]